MKYRIVWEFIAMYWTMYCPPPGPHLQKKSYKILFLFFLDPSLIDPLVDPLREIGCSPEWLILIDPLL